MARSMVVTVTWFIDVLTALIWISYCLRLCHNHSQARVRAMSISGLWLSRIWVQISSSTCFVEEVLDSESETGTNTFDPSNLRSRSCKSLHQQV